MTVTEALSEAVARLAAAKVDGGSTDARKLLRFVLGAENTPPDPERLLTEAELDRFRSIINRRSKHQPVAQIIGKREFWGREFKVTKDTLDPRPDSELIIECVLELDKPRSVLDLGTGTGCLLLTILAECPDAVGIGTDISQAALSVAAQNASSLQLTDRTTLIESDWFSQVEGSFDLIVSNPPYISAKEMDELQRDVRDWEPHEALTPGGDGLDAYRTTSKGLNKHLNGGGTAIFEVGAMQAADVMDLFVNAGFKDVKAIKDLNGKDRTIMVRRSGL